MVRASDVLDALSLTIKTPPPKASHVYDGYRAAVDSSVFFIGLGAATLRRCCPFVRLCHRSGPLSSPGSRALCGRDVRMAVYRNHRKDADGGARATMASECFSRPHGLTRPCW